MNPILYHMDARVAFDHLENDSIDLIISGPPYYDHLVYSQDPGNLSNESLENYLSGMRTLMEKAAQKLKLGGVIGLWVHDIYHRDGEQTTLTPLHALLLQVMPPEIQLRHITIWDRYLKKIYPRLPAGASFGTRVQYILLFSKGPTQYESTFRRLYWQPIWYLKTMPRLFGFKTLYRPVFELSKSRVVESITRPVFEKTKQVLISDDYAFARYATTCPPEVAHQLITHFSREGDTVLDPFAGSGTSLLAAHQLKRQAIGCEINPEAVKVIQKNIPNIQTIRNERFKEQIADCSL